jgi:catechol 2,3-dioxygenase-like lactoylglutathione lyase family enzyme
VNDEFPGAVPEIPVSDVDQAAAYYKDHLGFTIDWGDEGGGGIGESRGDVYAGKLSKVAGLQ